MYIIKNKTDKKIVAAFQSREAAQSRMFELWFDEGEHFEMVRV